MERIKIFIQGIQRDVSPAMAPTGSCQDMVNLRVKDGALRPIKNKAILFQATAAQFIPPPPEDPIEPEVTYTLTTLATGDGTINVNGSPFLGEATFIEGQSVSLAPVPDYGWVFQNWETDLTGDDQTEIIVMNTDKTVGAVFAYEDELGVYNEAGTVEITEPVDGTGSDHHMIMIKAPVNGWYLEAVAKSADGEQEINIVVTEYSEEMWNPVVLDDIYPDQKVIKVSFLYAETGVYTAVLVFRTPGGLTKEYSVSILVN